MSIYTDEGYKNRKEYLESLAENYGLSYSKVKMMADLMPGEEFDGLITMLEDYECEDEEEQEEN